MIHYKTVSKEAKAEQIIERSRFIAHVRPVATREEGNAFLEQIRTQHKTATHHVPAMVIGDKSQFQWASDDGEPKGTSGAPMIQLLVNEGITDVAIVVTRYFGGVKLGTGGLVRAYTSTAKLGLEAAEICIVEEMALLSFRIDYSYLSKIQSLAQSKNIQIEDIIYEELVTLKVVVLPADTESVKRLFADVTAGRSAFLMQDSKLVKKSV